MMQTETHDNEPMNVELLPGEKICPVTFMSYNGDGPCPHHYDTGIPCDEEKC